MRNYLWILLLPALFMSCNSQQKKLYQSDKYTIYPDKVVQGDYTAQAESPTKITSDYRSTASENFSRLITFKFSINEKDNEKRSGNDHWVIIDKEHQSPVITFGATSEPMPADAGATLPANYEYTFRVDMTPVFRQFKEKGFYTTFNGKKIAEEDFKAVYIAGGSEPLSWDFSNLKENNLEMKDPDGDTIFEKTVTLNPYNENKPKMNAWELSQDISGKPSYHSDQPLVDALFNLSLEEALINIEDDSTLRTGAKWGGVWTRDISYSILLAFAYHEPEIAKISLMRKVKNDRIIQDTGSGGAWPVSSDRTTWAMAAWELYKVTGDKEWLQKAYAIIKNTLEDDFKTLRCDKTGMYRGESSFLDWREQTYPKWMSNKDIYLSQSLGTNVVHYQAHRIAARMAKLLGEPSHKFSERARQIKSGINQHLWIPERGYYGQYLYGRTHMMLSPRFEALGESLAVLFDVANPSQARSIVSHAPLTPYGTTCIYPQIPDIPPYHNNGIWPFVQAYWNLAAAKAGNEAALNHGLAAIYRPAALFLSNYENFVAENGDYIGTEINSHRMLWSMAGNLAMVHRVFMGMQFKPNGIRFQPTIPKNYDGTRSLKNFTYRDANLDITVKGHGNEIDWITLDGEKLPQPFLKGDISGKHELTIKMKNSDFKPKSITLLENHFSLPAPKVLLKEDKLVWDTVDGSQYYNIYKNGALIKSVSANEWAVETEDFTDYSVTAVDSLHYESFGSEPVMVYRKNKEEIIEMEAITQKANLPYRNYSGSGFAEVSTSKNRKIPFEVNVPAAGTYRLDFRYSNGTGPWNTDNNCAVRSLYLNDDFVDVVVLPQRGEDEWSDWGYSNDIRLKLKEGSNNLSLRFEAWNTNMDGNINKAMLDYIRLIKME